MWLAFVQHKNGHMFSMHSTEALAEQTVRRWLGPLFEFAEAQIELTDGMRHGCIAPEGTLYAIIPLATDNWRQAVALDRPADAVPLKIRRPWAEDELRF